MNWRTSFAAACLVGALVPGVPADAENIQTRIDSQRLDLDVYGVSRVAFSNDGREVAFLGHTLPDAASQNFKVEVYDTASHKLLKALAVTSATPKLFEGGIAFSPNGSELAAGVDEVTIWDTRTWSEKQLIRGPFVRGDYAANNLLDLAYTPDGGEVVALYDHVWSPADIRVGSAQEMVRLSEAARMSYRAGNAPMAYQRPEVEVYESQTGKSILSVALGSIGSRGDRSLATSGLAISRNGSAAFVAIIDREGMPVPPHPDVLPRVAVQRIDLATGEPSFMVDVRQEGRFTAVAVGNSGSLIATGEAAGDMVSRTTPAGAGVTHENQDPIRLWSQDASPPSGFTPASGAIRGLYFLAGNSRLLACQRDSNDQSSLVFLDTKAKIILTAIHFSTSKYSLTPCAVSSNEQRAVVAGSTNGLLGSPTPDTAYIVNLQPSLL